MISVYGVIINLQFAIIDFACQEGHELIVDKLIAAGANVNSVNNHGNTPLHFACFRRRLDISLQLVKCGASVQRVNYNNKNPLLFAGPSLAAKIKQAAFDNVDLSSVLNSVMPSNIDAAKTFETIESNVKIKFLARIKRRTWDIPDYRSIQLHNQLLVYDDRLVTYMASYHRNHATQQNFGTGITPAAATVNGPNSLYHVYCKRLIVKHPQDLKRAPYTGYKLKELKDSLRQLQLLYHQNICTALGICFNEQVGFVGIVWEVPLNSLKMPLSDILQSEEIMLSPVQVLKYAQQVVQGLKYLHENSNCHLNLKSRNVLIHKMHDGERAMLIDYGLSSTALGDVNRPNWKPGQIISDCEWYPPELIQHGDLSTLKSRQQADVYSFGILLSTIVTRVYPYADLAIEGDKKQRQTILQNEIIRKNLRPTLPDYLPQVLKELMRQCWHPLASERPPLIKILADLTEMISIEAS